jgi:hypothetical protein
MTTFFVDLWHDLREKRLWPVAVGLLAAIVAVPAILFKPVSDATPPVAPAQKPTGLATLPVVTVDTGPTHGSRLEAFKASEKNPFKPMKDLAKAPASGPAGGAGSAAASASASAGSGSGGGSSSSSTSGSSGSSTSGSSTSGSSTSGGGSSSGGSTSGGSTSPTRTWFRYAADFSFGRTGDKAKKFQNVANFTMLPNEATPAVLFLGVDADGKTALFYLADPSYTADGEGTCNAAGAACRYLTLKIGQATDEETFTAVDGSVSYDLKLLKISRQNLGSGSTPDTSAVPKNGKSLAATGKGVDAATASSQSILPAMFAAGPGVGLDKK